MKAVFEEQINIPKTGTMFYSNVSRGRRKMQDQDSLIPSTFEPVEDPDFSGDGSSKARHGATRLPVAAQTMHESKRDFLRIECWWSVWARDSQLPHYEDYLYRDPDYPIETYVSWF